jgi:glycosyltransferase involved in cell wall biosynthesis
MRSDIHLWFPDIFEFKGGIQVYSAFLLSALQKAFPQSLYRVFLKQDTRSTADLQFLPTTKFHFAGHFPAPIRTIAFAAQLLTHGLWQPPDLVITTHVNFTILARVLKQLRGVPYWTVAHGVDAWDIDRPALKAALKDAERILAVSNYTRDRLLNEQKLDPNRVVVLPNTFDANRFQIAPKPAHLLQRYNLTPDQPVILTVARLASADRDKGYDQIIQTIPKIRQHLPNVRYLLVGKGSDRPRIEQLICSLDLEQHVTLSGFVADADLGDHYNLCDVFAMPNKTEGFGIVYLEALACGKPTVGGNQDGAQDALCQGKLGVLVDPEDVEAIAHTLTQILQGTYAHPILYQPEVLRQTVIETFGFDRFQQTLAAFMTERKP